MNMHRKKQICYAWLGGMEMLKIAICDDSRVDIEQLETALDSLYDFQIDYDVYLGAGELLEYLSKYNDKYHLYIFDIEMPDMTGLELAKELRKRGSKALFVFLTGYSQYVMDVFDVFTFAYIQKPVTTEKLESVLSRAVRYLEIVKQDFVFHFRRNQFRISYGDILYIEKKGRQAVIHTMQENFRANMTVSEIWEQLDSRVFVHIHVSFIINMEHLRSIEGDEAVMDNGERLLVARAHMQELKEKHMEFVRRTV